MSKKEKLGFWQIFSTVLQIVGLILRVVLG